MRKARLAVSVGALLVGVVVPRPGAGDQWSKAVWVGDVVAVRKYLASDGSLAFLIPNSGQARAIAVDGTSGRTCTFGPQDHLRYYSFDTGALLFDTVVPVPPPTDGDTAHVVLAVDERNQNVLLGVDNHFIEYDHFGRYVGTSDKLSVIQGFASETVHSKAWIATESDVEDQNGMLLNLPAGETVEAISADPRSGELWVATSGSLLRFDYTGAQELSIPLSGLRFVSSDGFAGAWAASTTDVYRIDATGAVTASFAPLPDPSIIAIAADPVFPYLWEAGLLDVREFDSTGTALITEAALVDVAALAVYADAIPPTLSITWPADNAIVGNRPVEVDVQFSDNRALDFASLSVSADSGAPAFSCNVSSTFARCFNSWLSDGSHDGSYTVTARISDQGGNSATASIHLSVDTTPPVLTVTAPTEGQITNQPSFTVSAFASEDLGGALVNGISATMAPDNRHFSRTIPLAEGSNTVNLEAWDLSSTSNTSQVVRHVVLDTAPPEAIDPGLLSVIYNGDGTVTVSCGAGCAEAGARVTLTNVSTGASVTVAANADGSFTATIQGLPQDALTAYQTDSATNVGPTSRTSVGGIYAPPDPATVAPANDPTVPTTFDRSFAFLFTGPNRVQTGQDISFFAPGEIGVLHGTVLDHAGQPLSGVKVSLLDAPGAGMTWSRASGAFDLVVNGDRPVTLRFSRSGYFDVLRQVEVSAAQVEPLPSVYMTALDPASTFVSLGAAAPAQMASASTVVDARGTRTARVFVPAATAATLVYPGGSTSAISGLTLRVTEFTSGANGLAAMPANLPRTTGYTYAAEYSADEVASSGADHVEFSQPVYAYVENFVGMPVGFGVPDGRVDLPDAQWIPEDDGRIVKILSVTGGLADLDVDGSGTPASDLTLSSLGFTDAERSELATTYAVGQSLWRVPLTRFSSHDFNWGRGPAGGDASAPNGGIPTGNPPPPCPSCEPGSILSTEDQSLGERFPIRGTPFDLTYWSGQQRGRVDRRSVDVPLTGATVPSNVTRVDADFEVLGKSTHRSFSPAPNLSTTFTWDGTDFFGRTVQGTQHALVTITFAFGEQYYGSTASVAKTFASVPSETTGGGITSVTIGDEEITVSVRYRVPVGVLDPKAQQLGGLTISDNHAYDPASRTVFYGDGGVMHTTDAADSLSKIAGGGGSSLFADGTPAKQILLNSADEVAYLPDGGYVLTDGNRILRVDNRGRVYHVGGSPDGYQGYSGDGGSALDAFFNGPKGIAVGPDGSLVIADEGNNVVRRIDLRGIVTTIAGDGTAATLNDPTHVAVTNDGSVLIVEHGRQRILRLAPDGTLRPVAGDGTYAPGSDGSLATSSGLPDIGGIAAAPEGGFYFLSSEAPDAYGGYAGIGVFGRVRKVGLDGVLHTVAGGQLTRCEACGATQTLIEAPDAITLGRDGAIFWSEAANGFDPDGAAQRIRKVAPDGKVYTVARSVPNPGGDGDPAIASALPMANALAVGPSGILLSGNDSCVRMISPTYSGYTGAPMKLPSGDGSEVFTFTADGRHTATSDALTGKTRWTFGYDSNGLLTSITDRSGNVTRISRTTGEVRITAPGGEVTTIALDANGYASSITDPGSNVTQLSIGSTGLLGSLRDPRGNLHSFTYEPATGRLSQDADPAGGSTSLSRSGTGASFTSTDTTALSRVTTRQVDRSRPDRDVRVTTAPDGTVVSSTTTDQYQTTVSLPDGATSSATLARDPRFGMMAPTGTWSVSTPGGRSRTETVSRAATLVDPVDPLSIQSTTETVSLNGKSYSTVYTASTRQLTTTTPAGRQRTLTLDSLGRVVSAQTGNLAPVSIAYDSQGRVQSLSQGSGSLARSYAFGYDPTKIDQLTSVTDPLTRQVLFHYDTTGRVDQQTLPDTSIVGASYDASSNLSTLTPPGRPAHAFDYTAIDLEQTYTPPHVTGDGTRSTGYSYNVDRQLTQVARPDARTVVPTYDPAKRRITGLTWSAGTETFGYDATSGQLNQVSAPGGVDLAFGYDGPLPTSESWSGTAGVSGSVTRAFDNDFRLTTEQVNAGNAATYGYDDDGLVTSVGAGGVTETISRRSDTGQISGTSAGGVSTTSTYNAFGEPARDTATYSGSTIYDAVYDDGGANPRDKLGRIAHLVETIQGVTHAYDYSYDARGRLTAVAVDGSAARSWTYDANGNRLTQTSGGVTTWYVYDDQDRLLCERSTSGTDCAATVTVSYAWTANGELASKTDPSGTTSYQYDELGNLRHVDLPGGHTIDYLIDGANRRVGRKYDGAVTNLWLYRNALKPVAELDGAGNVVARFVYGSKGQVPDLIVKGGVTYRVISDHLGTPKLVVDQATGAVVERLDVDEWGNVTSDSNPGWMPFGFDGGMFDGATGLVRFGARDYDARIGRWTAKDPIGFAAGGVNLYSSSDPANFLDPNGTTIRATGPGTLSALIAVEQDSIVGPYVRALDADPSIRIDIKVADLSQVGYSAGAETVPGRKGGGCSGGSPWTIEMDPSKLASNSLPLDEALAHEFGHILFDTSGIQGPFRVIHVYDHLLPPSERGTDVQLNVDEEMFAQEYGRDYGLRHHESTGGYFDPWSIGVTHGVP